MPSTVKNQRCHPELCAKKENAAPGLNSNNEFMNGKTGSGTPNFKLLKADHLLSWSSNSVTIAMAR